ncbi:MAG: hypothetical protein WBO04_14535 [Steroidobacteraceae bacterium]
MNMISGIKWIRSRQRALARGALALFALAWLQAAIVPCTMALAADHTASAAQSPRFDAHDGHGLGHDGHDGHAGHDPDESQVSHCPYCPPAPDDQVADCDHQTECAFPHDPRIDARTLTACFGPPPSQFVDLGSRLDAPSLRVAASDVPRDIPRLPLAIRYCRYIE